MLRSLLVFLILSFAALQYALWFGKGGITEWHALHQDATARAAEVHDLEQRNHVLKVEIIDLQTGLEAVEERARNDLGLIAPGETFYWIVRGER